MRSTDAYSDAFVTEDLGDWELVIHVAKGPRLRSIVLIDTRRSECGEDSDVVYEGSNVEDTIEQVKFCIQNLPYEDELTEEIRVFLYKFFLTNDF